MNTIFPLIISLLIIPTVFVIVTMTTHWDNYKYFKPTYDAINNYDYVLISRGWSIETYRQPSERNRLLSSDEILFFERSGKIDSIKLIGGGTNYIHDEGGWDLYARYWFKKIMRARTTNNDLYEPPRERREYTMGTPTPDVIITMKRPFKFLRG